MSKLSPKVLSIILGLVIFVVGIGVGIFYQISKDAPRIKKVTEAIKQLASKAIPSVIAYGQIINIEGRNLTVSFDGENVTVKIREDAAVTSLIPDVQGKTSQQNITFSQIKKGETVSINTKILPDGQLQGDSIMVLSSSR